MPHACESIPREGVAVVAAVLAADAGARESPGVDGESRGRGGGVGGRGDGDDGWDLLGLWVCCRYRAESVAF